MATPAETAPSETPSAPAKPRRRRRFDWGFGRGFLTIFALMLWVELAVTLVNDARSETGSDKWLYALGVFFLVLPLLAVAVYRFDVVFGFFRSVKVGVTNLVFIGVASCLGVLFHQEDPNFPIPASGVEKLAANAELPKPWPADAQRAYSNFQDFRNAHAYFTYKVTHGLGYHKLPGVDPVCRVDEQVMESSLVNLETHLPELETRFGEEFAVGLRANSKLALVAREQNAEIDAFQRDWNDKWWSLFVVASRLDLIRVYKSDWFATFWVILFFGVLSNTFRGGWRRLLRPGKWGFLITHIGVMLVILGGFWGRVTEARGIVEMNVGEIRGTWQLYDGNVRKLGQPPLVGADNPANWDDPFLLRLDAFRADYFDVLDVVYAKPDAQGQLEYEFKVGRQPKYRVYEGMTASFDWGPDPDVPEGGSEAREPWLRLEVEEYQDQARMRRVLRAAGPDDEMFLPLARLAIAGPDGEPQEQLLTTLQAQPMVHGPSGARILYELAETEDAARRRLDEPLEESFGWIVLAKAEQVGAADTFQARPGLQRTLTVEDRSYEVEVITAVPSLQLVRSTDGSMEPAPMPDRIELIEPSNPAVLLRITGPGGEVEDRWVLEQSFQASEARFKDLSLSFGWDRWSAPALSRWILFQLPDDSLRLGRVGEPESLVQQEPGRAVPLDRSHELVVAEAYRQAVAEVVPEPVEGADFFHTAPASARIRATTPEWSRTFVLVADEDPESPWRWQQLEYPGPDGKKRNVLLQFRPDLDDLPFEWRSELTVLREGDDHGFEEVASGMIRVNDYFHFEGFRFFQTNAKATDPTYSGIGAVYDPGMETVLLGLYMVSLGTIIVFLVKPMVTRKHRGI